MLNYQLYADKAGGFRWRLRAKNGRILADSGESYTRRRDADKAFHDMARGLVTYAVKVEPDGVAKPARKGRSR